MKSIRGFHWVPVLACTVMLAAATSVSASSTATITTLAIDPLTPTTLYAGTAAGVFKSTDGGATWSLTTLTNANVSTLAIAPRADAAEPATLFAGTYDGTVFKTTDGGATWSFLFSSRDYIYGVAAILDLAIDPLNPSVLAFGTPTITGWFEDGSGWTVTGAVFSSIDGGTNWSLVVGGLVYPFSCMLGGCDDAIFAASFSAVAFAPRTDPNAPVTLYAGEWNGTVMKVGGDWDSSQVSGAIRRIAIDSRTPNTLYAGTTTGLYRSADAGVSWNATGLTGVGVLSVVIDPQTATTLYAATEGGAVLKSQDGGTSWSNTGPTGVNVFAMSIDAEVPSTLYAGTSDGVYRSVDGGATWSATGVITWSHIATLTVDPAIVTSWTASTGRVTLSGEAPAGGAVVALSASEAWAVTVPVRVTVPEGSTSADFTISTNPVVASIQVTIWGAYAGLVSSAALTVTPGTTVSSVTLSPISVTGGSTSVGTVTLSAAAPAGGAVIVLAILDDAGVATIPASVTIAAGVRSATFTVSTTRVTASTAVTIFASYGGVNQFALLTVAPPTLSSVSLSPTGITGGSSSIGTVTLSGPAPTTGAIVVLSSSNVAAATVPATVVVPAGSTSASFTVSTSGSCAPATATIAATYAGVNASTVLTVLPRPADTVTIQRADYVRNRKLLRVSATSSVTTAALQVFVTSSGALIGGLTSQGGGSYSGEYNLQLNPQSITVRSSACGSATKHVEVK
jgi:hypothetical protein